MHQSMAYRPYPHIQRPGDTAPVMAAVASSPRSRIPDKPMPRCACACACDACEDPCCDDDGYVGVRAPGWVYFLPPLPSTPLVFIVGFWE